MIVIVDALNAHRFEAVLDDVYRLRARVFQDRLGWAVNVKDGQEIDEYDYMDPAVVVCFNDNGEVVGCMRLLQTTGPHMLSDVFYELLDGEPPLRSAQIWEATRFCVDTNKLRAKGTKNTISYVTSMVMLGAFEYAKEAGVLDAVAVIDPVMNRVLQRSGNKPYDYLGSPKQMGVVKAMAALMDCSDERIASIRDYSNIQGNIFLTDDEALALHEKSKKPQPVVQRLESDDLQQYCLEQLAHAETEADFSAAVELFASLSHRFSQEQLDMMGAHIPYDFKSNMSLRAHVSH